METPRNEPIYGFSYLPGKTLEVVINEMVIKFKRKPGLQMLRLDDTTPYEAHDEPPGRHPLSIGFNRDDPFTVTTFCLTVRRWLESEPLYGRYKISVSLQEPVAA